MGKFDELRGRKDSAIIGMNRQVENIQILSDDAERVKDIALHANIIIGDLENQFQQATKLDSLDIKFLFFATALQCVRQYILGYVTERVDDKTAAKKVKGDEKEHSDRKHQLYKPSLQEIETNPVPYDAISGSKKFNAGIGGGFEHRAKTLGHDCILGWVFGTANIATSTLTTSEGLKSYHILTGENFKRDWITYHADTGKVLHYTKEKLFNEGVEGKLKIVASLKKEAIHLQSDIYSTVSLPVPVVSTFSVDAAKQLAEFGIDAGNIIKVTGQVGMAAMINALIGMIHGLYYDETKYFNWNLYSVKTRKILMYSNIIASSSNVIGVAMASIMGATKALNYLDVGGIMVTIYRLVNDRKFIESVKKEFLEKEFYNLVMGDIELKED